MNCKKPLDFVFLPELPFFLLSACSGGRIVSWIIYCWLVWCERKTLFPAGNLRSFTSKRTGCIAITGGFVLVLVYLAQLFCYLLSCRHYILDLMRVTPRDSNYIGQEHRFCVLRPELIASFVEVSLSHFLILFAEL